MRILLRRSVSPSHDQMFESMTVRRISSPIPIRTCTEPFIPAVARAGNGLEAREKEERLTDSTRVGVITGLPFPELERAVS